MVIQCRGNPLRPLAVGSFCNPEWIPCLCHRDIHIKSFPFPGVSRAQHTSKQSWWGLYSEIVVCWKPSVVSGSKRLCLGFFFIFCNKITQQRWGTGERVFLVHSFRLPPIVVMKPAVIWTSCLRSFHSQEQGAMNRWVLSPTCFLCS